MNSISDNNITTAAGYNIRVTARTKQLAECIQDAIARRTGANKPLSAIIGELVFERAKDMGIDG